jgi:hypothetical protein
LAAVDAPREERGEEPPPESNEAVRLNLICEAFWKLCPTLPSNRGSAASRENGSDEDVDLTRLGVSVGEYRRIAEEVAAPPAPDFDARRPALITSLNRAAYFLDLCRRRIHSPDTAPNQEPLTAFEIGSLALAAEGHNPERI